MRQRKTNKQELFWFMLFLALFLIGTNRAVKAEEREVKLKGDCYYTEGVWTGEKNEIEIVGIRKGVKNPHIPDKIDGKKVTSIWLSSNLEEGEKNIETLEIPRYAGFPNVDKSEKPIRIKNYKLHAKNKYFCIKSGCLYSKDGKVLLGYPNGRKKKSLTVPEGTEEIDYGAFRDSLVEKVSLPESVKKIGGSAFVNSKLKSINLPSKLKAIEAITFMGSDIRSIVFPKSLKTIKFSAFQNCKKLKSVTIPKKNHLIDIEEDAFRGCSRLKRFIYPKPIVKRTPSAYTDISPMIGTDVFRNCIHLEKVELPENLDYMGGGCFYNCRRLKEITLKSTVGIGWRDFYNCRLLRKVTLSDTKHDVYIASGAFQTCGKLKEIRIASKSKKGDIDEEAFVKEGEKRKLTIIAPKNSYAYNYAKKHRKQGFKVKELK